ncbi:unnamed protein product [Pylaiella littoralis]
MLTSILPPLGFVPKTEGCHALKPKMTKFKTPFTLDTVFGPDPGVGDLVIFTKSRGVDFESLSDNQKKMWRTSWRDNRILCGYLVVAVVFPSYLKRRIKLREAETHWVNLDNTTSKGKAKLEERRICMNMVESMKASSCFRGTSDIIHPDVLVRDFLGIRGNDEGVQFFKFRDFARDSSKNSSAHASCAAISSHLWFVTTILGRPWSLDSVVVPVRGEEMLRLEELGICGKVSSFPVDWRKDVFPKLPGYLHDKVAGLLERLTSDTYLDEYPCDAFLLYKAKITGNSNKIHPGSKQPSHTLAVVPSFDTLLARTNTCDLDALDVSAIEAEYGKDAAHRVWATESVGVFAASMGKKMNEAIKFFSEEHLLVRRFVNNRLKVTQCMDPGGLKKKVSGGRLLDPRIASNVEAVKDMISQISDRTWVPIKRVIFKLVESMNPYMHDEELCKVFLQVGGNADEQEEFQRRAIKLGVTTVDISNVCFLLCLTISFQRSQVLRDSTVGEYIPTRDGHGYTLSIDREVKTTGCNNDGYAPCREFELSASQSTMVHFIKLAGGRKGDQKLLVNERGGDMTQNNLGARYRSIGQKYLGISNLSPHAMRTFFASHVIDSGKVEQRDLNELGSFLQVSAKTLSTAYVASSTNTEAHKIGKRALSDIMTPGARKMSKGENANTFDTESRPAGKKLGQARDIYKDNILASVKRYKSIHECFKALIEQRKNGFLQKNDAWFEFRDTYFSDEDQKFFVRFVRSRLGVI